MQRNRRVALEICVSAPQGLTAASGLADRVELCSALELGGLTPGPGLMRAARDSGIETHVLIRPQAGAFTMDRADVAVACADIRAVRDLGLAGVVIGALREGALDTAALAAMIDAATGLHVTLHRAIDTVTDPAQALETAIDLGMGRVLTSGGAPTASAGVGQIAALQAQAAGRITIMAGAGISPDTAASLVARTGVRDVHASCRLAQAPDTPADALGFGPEPPQTDRATIAALRQTLDQVA